MEIKTIKQIRDFLQIEDFVLLGYLKPLFKKHYTIHVANTELSLSHGGRVTTILLNKGAKYLDPRIYTNLDEDIIFPFDGNFR